MMGLGLGLVHQLHWVPTESIILDDIIMGLESPNPNKYADSFHSANFRAHLSKNYTHRMADHPNINVASRHNISWMLDMQRSVYVLLHLNSFDLHTRTLRQFRISFYQKQPLLFEVQDPPLQPKGFRICLRRFYSFDIQVVSSKIIVDGKAKGCK